MSHPMPFGRFILSKKQAPGEVGELAKAAARDASFPVEGSPREVSQRLNQVQAPCEYHELIEELEAEWRSVR